MGKNEPRHLAQNGADTGSKFLSFWYSDATGEIALRASYAELSRTVTEVLPFGGFNRIEAFIDDHQAGHADTYFCPAICPPGGRLGDVAELPGLFAVLAVTAAYDGTSPAAGQNLPSAQRRVYLALAGLSLLVAGRAARSNLAGRAE